MFFFSDLHDKTVKMVALSFFFFFQTVQHATTFLPPPPDVAGNRHPATVSCWCLIPRVFVKVEGLPPPRWTRPSSRCCCCCGENAFAQTQTPFQPLTFSPPLTIFSVFRPAAQSSLQTSTCVSARKCLVPAELFVIIILIRSSDKVKLVRSNRWLTPRPPLTNDAERAESQTPSAFGPVGTLSLWQDDWTLKYLQQNLGRGVESTVLPSRGQK